MSEQLRPYLPYLISVPIILVVLVLRLRGMSRGRPLRAEWLWVTPVLLMVMAGLLTAQAPPTTQEWMWLALPLALGGILGWYRGKMMQISVDPDTHALTAKASPAALYLIVGIILLRYVLNIVSRTEASSWGVRPMFITDLLMAFGIGLLGVQRVEMFLRARRLVTEARAAKAAA